MASSLSLEQPIGFLMSACAPRCPISRPRVFLLTLPPLSSHQNPTGQRHDWCYGSANGQGSEEAKAAAKCK